MQSQLAACSCRDTEVWVRGGVDDRAGGNVLIPSFPKRSVKKKAAYLPAGGLCKIGSMFSTLHREGALRKANVINGSFSEEAVCSKKMMLLQNS